MRLLRTFSIISFTILLVAGGVCAALSAKRLDPFCGGGTTLVAAMQGDRSSVGVEIDERTCEVAAIRLSQETLDFSELDIIPTQMALLPESS